MKDMEDGPILCRQTGFVATITLNKPPHNPLGMAAIDRLEALFTDLASDESVRAVVLTGAGDRTFSVGADIKEFGAAIESEKLRICLQEQSLKKP